MKYTQREMVIEKLNLDGFVTRNWALSKYCSRLGALICNLKSEGWNIEGKNDNGDYIYEVKGSPFKKEYLRLPDGQIITRIIKK